MITKKGFTLLEVLFNIVILTLILTIFLDIFYSANQNNKKVYLNNLLFNSETLLENILLRKYDENNIKDISVSLLNNGDSELQKPRIGKLQINNNDNRKITNISETNFSKLGTEDNESINDITTLDDIDDFNNYKYETPTYSISTEIYYTNDETNYSDDNNKINFDYKKVNKNTNIKTIKIIATSKMDNKKIVLYYNSLNIGSSHLFKLSEINH